MKFVFLAISISKFLSQNCGTPVVRKEIRQLTPEEKDIFFNALNQMNTPGPNGQSVYDQLVQKHLTVIKYAHGYAPFLPWHRYFIIEFEKELRKFAPGIGLPYWDWSLDSQAPERSPILTDEYFGNANGHCIQSGPIKNWSVSFPNRHCLQRKYNGGNSIGVFFTPESIDNLINRSETYNDFRKNLENQAHGLVHEGLGSDMSIMISPNDPIFYLHHSYVDKLWVRWQSKNPENVSQYFGEMPDNRGWGSPSDFLQDTRLRIGDILDNKKLCYTYSETGSDSIRSPLNANQPPVPGRGPPPTGAPPMGRNPGMNGPPGRNGPPPRNGPPGRNGPPPRNNRPLERRHTFQRESCYDREGDLNKLRKPKTYSKEWIKMNNLNENEVNKEFSQEDGRIDKMNKMNYKSPVSLGSIGDTINDLLKGDVLSGLTGANLPLLNNKNGPLALDSVLGSDKKDSGVLGL